MIQRFLFYLRALSLEAGMKTLTSYKPTAGFPLGGDPAIELTQCLLVLLPLALSVKGLVGI